MENTQSFSTPRGIQLVKQDFQKFQRMMKAGQRKSAAHEYNRIYQDTLLFPPCNVVNSLRDDLVNYRLQNILGDLQVIEDDQDKMKY